MQTCREWICMSAFGVFCSYTPKSIGCLLKTMLISGVPQFIRDIPKCIWIYKWQAKERCSGWELCTRNGSHRSKDIPIPGASASSVMQATLQRWERNSKRVENRLAPWKALWAFGPNFDEASTTVAINHIHQYKIKHNMAIYSANVAWGALEQICCFFSKCWLRARERGSEQDWVGGTPSQCLSTPFQTIDAKHFPTIYSMSLVA